MSVPRLIALAVLLGAFCSPVAAKEINKSIANNAPIATTALRQEASGGTIDWAKGDIQATSASCGDFTFTHMKDRHGYSLYIRGRKSVTCSFHEKGLTFHFPSNHGPTTTGTTTLYGFTRVGADVVVSWMPGY